MQSNFHFKQKKKNSRGNDHLQFQKGELDAMRSDREGERLERLIVNSDAAQDLIFLRTE